MTKKDRCWILLQEYTKTQLRPSVGFRKLLRIDWLNAVGVARIFGGGGGGNHESPQRERGAQLPGHVPPRHSLGTKFYRWGTCPACPPLARSPIVVAKYKFTMATALSVAVFSRFEIVVLVVFHPVQKQLSTLYTYRSKLQLMQENKSDISQ